MLKQEEVTTPAVGDQTDSTETVGHRGGWWVLAAASALVVGVVAWTLNAGDAPPDSEAVAESGPSVLTQRAEALRDQAQAADADGYAVAEANRVETLSDLSAAPLEDGFATAEANRVETLSDLTVALGVDGYSVAELNRFEAWRDVSAAPDADGHATAELNRVETLSDLTATPASDR